MDSTAPSPPRHLRRRLIQAFLLLIGGLLLIGIAAPFVNAQVFAGDIQRALESALGRKVQIGKAHFTLFAGPGFSLDDVTIGEDPRFGLEPFAHVETLQVRVRPDKLLLGRIQISSLRLERPSLNFVQEPNGAWNVVELTSRLAGPRRAPLNFFAAVELSDARIDFKLGLRKTTLYLAQTDLALYPERSGRLTIRFAGSPARTDRAGQGFGHFRGDVIWLLAPDSSGRQVLGDITLDPSNLAEITTLIQGYDIGIHGTAGTNLHIEGPAESLQLSGEFRLNDVHRWDLLPSTGEDWRVRYRGALDLVNHRFNLVTLPDANQSAPPVALQVKVADLLTKADWTILATLTKAPAGSLLPLAERMGIPAPQGLKLEGLLNGVLSYSSRSGVEGQVSLDRGAATLPGVAPLHASSATGIFTPDHFHLDAISEAAAPAGHIQVSADYSFATRAVEIKLLSEQAEIADLTKTLREWFNDAPVIDNFSTGRISGQLDYIHIAPEPPVWNGQLQLAEASMLLPGVASPLTGIAARLSFDQTGVDVRGLSATAGDLALRGEYHYAVKGPRHEHLKLDLPAADLAQLETLLEPSLHSTGLFARLRPTRRSIPEWMAQRNLEADLSIDRLSVSGVDLGDFKTHLVWDAANVQLTSFLLRGEQAALTGKGTVNLTATRPRYRLNATAANLPWKDGDVTLDGRLDTSSLGADVLRNLRGSGTFSGNDWNLSPDLTLDTVSGKYTLSLEDGWPNLTLTDIRAEQEDQTWEGSAASNRDGQLTFDLSNGTRQLHIVSPLSFVPAPSSTPPAPSPSLAASQH